MPTNITRGRTAQFIVEFVDENGALVTPSSGQITINYAVDFVTQQAVVALSQSGSFWTGTWDSTPADLGIADWSVSSPLTTSPAQVGQLNIIDP